MSDDAKRSTIYFDPDIHRALLLKAAETDRSISEMVHDAIKLVLGEDVEDLAAFEDRKDERAVSFEEVVRCLKRSGKR